ncbi:MAG: hypothetical protein R3F11_06420 [Verrucomicrobiales bacterium]
MIAAWPPAALKIAPEGRGSVAGISTDPEASAATDPGMNPDLLGGSQEARCCAAPRRGAVPPLGLGPVAASLALPTPAMFRRRSMTGAAMPRAVATPRRGSPPRSLLRVSRLEDDRRQDAMIGRCRCHGSPPDRCGNWWIRRPVGWELVVQPGSWRFSRGAWHRPFAAPQQMPE